MNKSDISLMTEAYSKVYEAGVGQVSFPAGLKGDQPMPSDGGAATPTPEPIQQTPQNNQSIEALIKSILPQLKQIIQQLS